MHMDGWQLVHGVGSDPAGPYRFVSTLAGIPASAYNPHTARLPDGRYLLYHGGARTSPTPKGYAATCTGNETAPSAASGTEADDDDAPQNCTIADCFNQLCQPQAGNSDSACIDAGCVLDPGFGECYPPAWNTSSSIHVRISHSAGGPWLNSTEVNIQGMSNILKIAAEAADNPSPLVIPNASSPSGYTILMAFRFPGGDSWCGKPRCAPSVIGLAKAEVRAMPPRLHECDLLSR